VTAAPDLVRPVRPGTTPAAPPVVRRERRQIGLIITLAVLSLLTLAPFAVMMIVALSPAGEPTIPHQWPSRLTSENLQSVFSQQGFLRWTLNSAIYSITTVVLILLTASMAGYAFAKRRFPGHNIVMWSMLAMLMVPMQVLLIPYFVMMNNLGGVDTYWGLIVPSLANAQAVFLLRQFINELPDELFEAATLDGASEWRIYVQIVLPLCKPILATLGIFVFLWHWNDFIWPLVITQSSEMQVLTVGLASMRGANVSQAEIMSGAAISVVPCLIVFAFAQRYLINSIATSGLKG
jgi:multiple sugar transport system permease protein